MPNYRETDINGKKWIRSNKVKIENPMDKTSSIHFYEEEVAKDENGDVVSQKYRGKRPHDMLADPNVEFDLLNPVDDSVVGNVTYGEVYAILYSLYRYLADKRDIENNG